MTTLDNYIAKKGTSSPTGSFGGGTTLDSYLSKSGVKDLGVARSLIEQMDKRKRQEELQRAMDEANQKTQEFNANQNKIASDAATGNIFQKAGAYWQMAKNFLGRGPTLPDVPNAPPIYNAQRNAQQMENAANQQLAGRAGNFLANDVGPAIMKGGAGVAKVLLATTAGVINPFSLTQTKENLQTSASANIGGAKNISELASGTLKLATSVATGKTTRDIAGFVGGQKVATTLDRTAPEFIKKTNAFVDNNGILNYKPSYANEAEKTGGVIAELGTWMIPITRAGKLAEIEKALAEIPRVEKILNATPRIIKSGGKLFFEVSKDAVDVGTLEFLRGKDWETIKQDAATAAVGGTFLRGGGKLLGSIIEKAKLGTVTKNLEAALGKLSPDETKLAAESIKAKMSLDEVAQTVLAKRNYEKTLQENTDKVLKRFGTVTENEQSIISSLTKEGKTAEEISAQIAKKKTIVANIIDESDQLIRGVAKKPADYGAIVQDIQTAKKEILALESQSTVADLQKQYKNAPDWKEQFTKEFGYKPTKEKITLFSQQALDTGTGHYQEIFDATTASEKSLRRKITSLGAEPKPTEISFATVKAKEPTTPKIQVSEKLGDVKEVPISKLTSIEGDRELAMQDFKAGKKSKTDMPVLVKKEADGSMTVLDGNGRILQAEASGAKTIAVTSNEKVYREILTQAEKASQGKTTGKVSKVASDINKKLAESGIEALPEKELAKYDPITKKKTIEDIANIMEDKNLSNRMALGYEKIPEGIKEQPLFNAVVNRAKKEGNAGLLMDLANSPIASERSRIAQELGSAGFNSDPESPIKNIQEIIRTRKEAIIKKFGEAKVTKETQAGVSEVKAKLKKAIPTKEDWNKFIESIKC